MTIPATEWVERAACKNKPLSVFFVTEKRDGAYKEAGQVCDRCPVKQECLDYALKYGLDWGFWGGADENERRRIRNRQELQTAREAS